MSTNGINIFSNNDQTEMIACPGHVFHADPLGIGAGQIEFPGFGDVTRFVSCFRVTFLTAEIDNRIVHQARPADAICFN